MDDDFYESSAPQYNAFSSPGASSSASAPPMYPAVNTPSSGNFSKQPPAPSAPREGGDLRGKVNKIKVSEPTDLPFVVEGLKKIYKVGFVFLWFFNWMTFFNWMFLESFAPIGGKVQIRRIQQSSFARLWLWRQTDGVVDGTVNKKKKDKKKKCGLCCIYF